MNKTLKENKNELKSSFSYKLEIKKKKTIKKYWCFFLKLNTLNVCAFKHPREWAIIWKSRKFLECLSQYCVILLIYYFSKFIQTKILGKIKFCKHYIPLYSHIFPHKYLLMLRCSGKFMEWMWISKTVAIV